MVLTRWCYCLGCIVANPTTQGKLGEREIGVGYVPGITVHLLFEGAPLDDLMTVLVLIVFVKKRIGAYRTILGTRLKGGRCKRVSKRES